MWLAQKTGDEQFIRKVPLASRGGYVTYEALNFVDGKLYAFSRHPRRDQRGVLSNGSGRIEQYFRFLAGVGVVTLDPPSGATR